MYNALYSQENGSYEIYYGVFNTKYTNTKHIYKLLFYRPNERKVLFVLYNFCTQSCIIPTKNNVITIKQDFK